MINMADYDDVPTATQTSRLRDFIRREVGYQPFTATQLRRAVRSNDPWFGKRNEASVRYAVNDVIRNMIKAGKLEVVGGEKRRRVFMLVGGGK